MRIGTVRVSEPDDSQMLDLRINALPATRAVARHLYTNRGGT